MIAVRAACGCGSKPSTSTPPRSGFTLAASANRCVAAPIGILCSLLVLAIAIRYIAATVATTKTPSREPHGTDPPRAARAYPVYRSARRACASPLGSALAATGTRTTGTGPTFTKREPFGVLLRKAALAALLWARVAIRTRLASRQRPQTKLQPAQPQKLLGGRPEGAVATAERSGLWLDLAEQPAPRGRRRAEMPRRPKRRHAPQQPRGALHALQGLRVKVGRLALEEAPARAFVVRAARASVGGGREREPQLLGRVGCQPQPDDTARERANGLVGGGFVLGEGRGDVFPAELQHRRGVQAEGAGGQEGGEHLQQGSRAVGSVAG